MLAKKIRTNPAIHSVWIVLALALFISGCTPAGPRALLKGKRYLANGDTDAAVEALKTATTLMATNAQAWNYYGVALQHAGQADDAANAYQQALSLDRDLVEAHYNLGWLWLEQNKPDAARTEFTAYTLRRPNDPGGWLELGSAQLRCSDPVAAEKSFSAVLYLNTNNPEAFNGLGLARIQRGRAHDAAQFFAAAIAYHPEYAPAYLNLATVSQEYLRDNAAAAKNYRAYLALVPQAANAGEINAIIADLERPAPVASASPVEGAVAETTVPTPVRTAPASKTYANRTYASPSTTPTRPEPVTPAPVFTAQPRSSTTVVSAPPVEVPEEEPVSGKPPGFWQKLNPKRWFGPQTQPPPGTGYDANAVTPLPSGNYPPPVAPAVSPEVTVDSQPPPVVVVDQPVKVLPPAPPVYPRYLYLSPRKPAPGNHAAAAAAFAKAQNFEQDSRWSEAMQAYGQAARFDPSWFEAQYNFGVLSHRLRNYSQALSAYEYALAIQPDSQETRYNFALALKAAGYMADAVNELNKVVAVSPGEVRAHLVLGNIYAQQLHDVAHARVQYQKVLQLDPTNSQATDIRFWLAANPE